MTAPIKDYLKHSKGFHSAKWSEPVIMELAGTGRRGVVFEEAPAPRLPGKAARKAAPVLPEVTEHDALRWLGAHELDDVAWLDSEVPFLAEVRDVLAQWSA